MSAIRIIRSLEPAPLDVALLERDEMVQAIALHIAEASGDPERLMECARKLRDPSVQPENADELLHAIDQGLQESRSPVGVHSELDLTRIFSLLED